MHARETTEGLGTVSVLFACLSPWRNDFLRIWHECVLTGQTTARPLRAGRESIGANPVAALYSCHFALRHVFCGPPTNACRGCRPGKGRGQKATEKSVEWTSTHNVRAEKHANGRCFIPLFPYLLFSTPSVNRIAPGILSSVITRPFPHLRRVRSAARCWRRRRSHLL